MTAGGTPTAAKAALRRQVRTRRAARAAAQDPAARHTDAERLADGVLAGLRRLHGDGASRVAAYEARPTEPPTDALLDRLLRRGHEVLVPVTLADLDLDWRRVGAALDDVLGAHAVADVAVVVVPALAVGRDGHRLGQGGGSYDRALPRRSPEAVVVALLYDDELVAPGVVPVDLHDVGVDAVVTPGGGWVSLSPRG